MALIDETPTPENPVVVHEVGQQKFEKFEEAMQYFSARAEQYVDRCPVLLMSLIPDTLDLLDAMKLLQAKGGISGFVDFRGLTKEQALTLIGHYEAALKTYRTFIEENLS